MFKNLLNSDWSLIAVWFKITSLCFFMVSYYHLFILKYVFGWGSIFWARAFFHYNKTEVCGVKCLAHAHATYYNCILCYDVW